MTTIVQMWRTCFSVSILVTYVTAAVLRNNDLFRLDIIHYNDFHDRFEETSVLYPICMTNDTNCLGGFPRLYHEVRALLKEKPDALVLNAGDVFQGTYWYTLFRWNVTQKFINMLPNDAHAIGNHEFDGGIEDLVSYLSVLRAPMLIANIDISNEPSLEGLYKPHTIVERRGRKIGLIGVITPDTKGSSKTGNVEFLDPIQAIIKEAQLLTDNGVDIIIVLSHCGLDEDKQIAKLAGANVDIIVGGHSHSLLWNGESPSNEIVSGPYPVVVKSEANHEHKVLVITASSFSKYLGNLTAYFDSNGELVSYDGEPVFLNRSIPEDPEIKALLQPYSDTLSQIVTEVIGYSNSVLDMTPCGGGECFLGSLMAEAFLNAANELNSNLSAVAFFTRNMIRGPLPEGAITRGAIINAMPFTNHVVAFTLQGKYLAEALERCIQPSWNKNPFSGPWTPQVAGMRVSLNATSRTLESLLVENGDIFEPIQLDQDYLVTTPDFLASGGSGFKMLAEHGRDKHDLGIDSKIFENYFRNASPVNEILDDRLTILF